MSPNENSLYSETLKFAANELSSGMGFPVNLNEVCIQLNVKIIRHNLPENRAFLVLTKNGVEIRLSNQGTQGEYTPFERFLIGHELGHFVLDKKCAASPISNSEYRQHEDLCNSFAGMLLLPDDILRSKLANVAAGPKQLLGLTAYL